MTSPAGGRRSLPVPGDSLDGGGLTARAVPLEARLGLAREPAAVPGVGTAAR
jgi:hypothetical protein